MTNETWRFNAAEWKTRIQAMADSELRALHCHHLNYVPNSPALHLTHAELITRAIAEGNRRQNDAEAMRAALRVPD